MFARIRLAQQQSKQQQDRDIVINLGV